MQLEMGLPDLVEALEKQHGSLNKASRRTDIPTTTLFHLKHGKVKDPRISTLQKIADGLNQDLPDMLRRYGIGKSAA